MSIDLNLQQLKRHSRQDPEQLFSYNLFRRRLGHVPLHLIKTNSSSSNSFTSNCLTYSKRTITQSKIRSLERTSESIYINALVLSLLYRTVSTTQKCRSERTVNATFTFQNNKTFSKIWVGRGR